MKKKVKVAKWRTILASLLMGFGMKISDLCFNLAFYMLEKNFND